MGVCINYLFRAPGDPKGLTILKSMAEIEAFVEAHPEGCTLTRSGGRVMLCEAKLANGRDRWSFVKTATPCTAEGAYSKAHKEACQELREAVLRGEVSAIYDEAEYFETMDEERLSEEFHGFKETCRRIG